MNMQVDIPSARTGQEPEPQPTLYLNWYCELADGTILSNEQLRLVQFNGQEELSKPFAFTLSLHGNTDYSEPLYKMSDLIGRMVTVGICVRDSKKSVPNGPFDEAYFNGADPEADFSRAMNGGGAEDFSFFNGMVTGFSMGEPGIYSLTMKPALWRLMLTNDYRVYAQKSIRTAIEGLLEKHQISYNTQDLVGDTNSADNRVQDWLQAGETDYDFIQRLLPKSNIHYYFVHSPRSHKIVFSNKACYPTVFEDDRTLKYTYSELEGVEHADVLKTYNYSQEISSTSVKGIYTRQEEAWESDTVAGEISFYSNPAAQPGDLPFQVYHILQYGGSAGMVNNYSSQIADMAARAATRLEGSTQNPEIRVGHKVQLEEGEHSGPPEVCKYLNQKWFVFTEARHQASLDGTYSCSFRATEAEGLITPFSLGQTRQGSVMAEVVAHGNGEMPTTWKYYEKSAFDPETSANTDTGASDSGVIGGIDPISEPNPKVLMAQGVYVRFTSEPDADAYFVKLSAGMQTCPEIGSMVLVARATDESELPEIQQSVQANGSKVVTPSGWTSSSHVGSSYSTNYGDSKSVRYGRMSTTHLDQAISIINGQYDTGQFRDASFSQGGGYSYSTSEQGRSGMLSKSDSFGNNYSYHEGDVSESYSDITRQESTSLNDTTESTSTITSWSKSHDHNLGDATSFHQTDGLTKSTVIQNNIESSNTTRGYTNTTSLSQGEETHSSVNEGKVTTSSTHNADVVSTSVNNGDISNTSTHNGNQTTHSTQTGNADSTSTLNGNSDSTQTNNGDVKQTSTTTGTETIDSTRNVIKQTSHTKKSTINSTVGSESVSNTAGTSSHTSKTGAAKSSSMVGASASMNLVGASADMSLLGAKASMSLIGTTNDLNLIGSNIALNLIGQQSGINITGTGMTLDLAPGTVNIRLPGEYIEIPNLHLKL